jgi:flagellar M-ring protein FliF
MNGLQDLAKHWARLWGEWTALQRASVAGGLFLCVALVAGVGIWATRPEFVALADRLSPTDSAEIVSLLEAQGIEYRLNFAGSAVLVPRSQLNQARLATKDVAPAQAAPEGSFSDGLWADPALTNVRLLHDQEQRIARSIMQMRAVRGATVHLSKPQATPFVRDRVAPKASVILDLNPGVDFTSSDAMSIVSLVSHSVEGLDPQHVSVLDTDGRRLSSQGGLEGDIAGQLDYRRHLETELASKAETMLAQLLGPGNAVVRVTADVDFTELSREETTFDPAAKVKTEEDISTEITSGPPASGAAAGGAAGAGGNLGGSVSGNPASSPVSSKIERNMTKYDNARIIDRLKEAPGKIKRMTVAAVVHPPQAAEGQQPPAIDKAAVESIIKQAVGFDVARTDQIEVMIAPRPLTEAFAAPPAATFWQQYEGLVRSASLGLGAAAALLLGFMIVKRLRPIAVEVPATAGLSLDAAHRLADVSYQVQRQPETAARVLAAWLDDDEEEERKTTRRSAAA